LHHLIFIIFSSHFSTIVHYYYISATIDTKHIINTLKNFNDIFYHSTVEQKKSLLHSLIETISINNGETTKERTINKIKLYFEPVDVQAQNLTKKFATTYDTVHRKLS